ncbi:hypothetical protein [Streptomyces sp. NPDC088674]|uniref:hypothetical protein n=1 Tax=Streptomyces sp. NPDC088674 TaxID=3365869 RepID=UPI0037FD29EC
MSYSFTDAEIQAAAVRLGVIKAGEDVPARLRSRVVASLVADRRRPTSAAEVPVAQQIIVEPGGQISVDGKPFPWVVQAGQIGVTLQPDGAGMVTLTMPALNIQITQPAHPESETS